MEIKCSECGQWHGEEDEFDLCGNGPVDELDDGSWDKDFEANPEGQPK